jgi:hypothetical protein
MAEVTAIKPQVTREESHMTKAMKQGNDFFILHTRAPYVYTYLTYTDTPPL